MRGSQEGGSQGKGKGDNRINVRDNRINVRE